MALLRWRTIDTTQPKELYGWGVLAFIHNGTQFAAVLHVFDDGAIDAWELTDWKGFRAFLARGWVSVGPAVKDEVSLFQLGSGTVAERRWTSTKSELESEIRALVFARDPSGQGFYQDKEVRSAGGVPIRYTRRGSPFREYDDEALPEFGALVTGLQFWFFRRVERAGETCFELTPFFLFADGMAKVGVDGAFERFDAVCARIRARELIVELPQENVWISMPGLGFFRVTKWTSYLDEEQFLRGAWDDLLEMQGGESAVTRCVRVLESYRAAPSEERRGALAAAYEAIAENQRVFVGDMDTRDSEVLAILYPDRFGPEDDEEDTLEE